MEITDVSAAQDFQFQFSPPSLETFSTLEINLFCHGASFFLIFYLNTILFT